jgi:hypothetical protein
VKGYHPARIEADSGARAALTGGGK